MKLSPLSVILASTLSSFFAAPVIQGEPIPLCSQQAKCFDFTTQVVTGPSSCRPEQPCVIKACMQYINNEGCPKEVGAPISHMCDSGDANGCLRDGSNLFDGGADGAACKIDESNEVNKCGGGKPDTIFCQEALPGETVHFIAADGLWASPDRFSNGGDGITTPIITCDNAFNLGRGNCGNIAKQAKREMVWSYTIPTDLVSLGCFPPPPPFCPAGTSLTKVDFSQDKDGSRSYKHGDYISDPGYGFKLSVEPGPGGKDVNIPRIYDSDMDTGVDLELDVGAGKLLIIQEDNGANDDPDDNDFGGKYFFNFVVPAKIKNIGLVVTQDPVLISSFKSDGSIWRTRPEPIENVSVTIVDVDQEGVNKLKIAAKGDAGIAFIELCV